jgi:ABC-type transport system involved in multi-copper enzyme maturation permease subunit
VRDRVLYNLVLFVLIIIACAILLGDLTDGHEARTIVNIGLNAILLFGAFIAIFVGVGLVSKEIEKRTVFAIFAKPVGRGEFIVGKYLGLCLTLAVNVAVMGIGVSLALVYVGGTDLARTIWPSILLIFFELMILTAVATLFSSFSSPALSALLTFFVFVIGHFSSSLRDLAAALSSQSAQYLFEAIYYVLPNLSHFTFVTNASHGEVPPAGMLLGSILYAIVFDAILIAAATIIFSRRNFK